MHPLFERGEPGAALSASPQAPIASSRFFRPHEPRTPRKRRPWGPLILVAVLLSHLGCTNDDADLVSQILPPMPGVPVSLKDDVQPIFSANCAFVACHGGAPLGAGQSLAEGTLFDPVEGIVGVTSTQVPSLLRVKPGSSMESYLINKLEGTQASVGGIGLQMPQFGTPLPDSTIQVIREWIDQGAQDN